MYRGNGLGRHPGLDQGEDHEHGNLTESLLVPSPLPPLWFTIPMNGPVPLVEKSMKGMDRTKNTLRGKFEWLCGC